MAQDLLNDKKLAPFFMQNPSCQVFDGMALKDSPLLPSAFL